MNELSEEDIKKIIANQETMVKMLDGLIKVLEEEKKEKSKGYTIS